MSIFFSQLLSLIQQKAAPAAYAPYPRLRNFILDVMAEGRRKNIINLVLEADITTLRQELVKMNDASISRPSLTSCIANSFVQAVHEDLSMQSYRQGKSRVVIFDEVDLAVMIERDIGNAMMPVPFIVRNAARKNAQAIHEELLCAKNAALGENGPMSAMEKTFFELPATIRKLVWFFIRRDPQLFKEVVGTVGLTSMGMHATGSAVCIPITPMTLTMSIGTIGKKLVMENGIPVEKEIIQLNLGADHDIIDGVPLMRFAERLKFLLGNASALDNLSQSQNV